MTGLFADLLSYLGRFHPVVVHLPIAFIILAVLFEGLSYRRKYKRLRKTVPLLSLVSFITAAIASLLGYWLSLQGDYDKTILHHHKTAGIWLAGITGLVSVLSNNRFKNYFPVHRSLRTVLLAACLPLLMFTGFEGGSLTYGRDYLSMQPLMQTPRSKPSQAGEAILFDDVVHPILTKRCQSCHREGKKKGKLSVATLAGLVKGGESGPAVVPGKPDKSELVRRITLDHDDEDFMPADGKTPLSKKETAIIVWWVEKGMAEGKKFSELPGHEAIEQKVSSFLGLATSAMDEDAELSQSINPEIPQALDIHRIENLRGKGLMVRVMLQKPLMLDVTLLPASEITIESFKTELSLVAPHIVWLNLSENNFTSKDLEILKKLINLEKLRLQGNPLGDEIVDDLIGLKHLEALNLNHTKVTERGVKRLREMGIQRIYWELARH